MKGTTTSVNATKERIPQRPNLLNKWLDVVFRSNADYDRATAFMEEVMSEIGQKREGYNLLCRAFYFFPGLDQHGLRQQDLSELGSQGVVSEILAGKRELNLRHIAALARRFKVPPEVFLPSIEAED